MTHTLTLDSISQIHSLLGLPKPKHPLITVIHNSEIQQTSDFNGVKVVNNLFQISLKSSQQCGTLRYGRNSYDYEEGTLVFTSPGQVLEYESGSTVSTEPLDEGWSLGFHPDLIRKSSLGINISRYSFFTYDVNEALHLSDDERQTIDDLLDKIIKEYSQNLDKHSQHLIIANLELLLDYCLRFYDRQFITRMNLNVDVVSKFERLLLSFYESEQEGLPTVNYCGKSLNLSANYLSDLLKKETGKTAQEHIHLFIIEKAKSNLLNSDKSISEIGYELGFEYPQHFSNLFKSKTGFSPREFRSFN